MRISAAGAGACSDGLARRAWWRAQEAQHFNLLTSEGRRGFSSRMRAHYLAREKEENEDQQEML